MSFVSKGEKVMHNKARGGSKPGERSAQADPFGKKGGKTMRNTAPGSKDKAKEPVSEDAEGGNGYDEDSTKSEYDPASGKRAKTTDDLREAYKKISERAAKGAEASPTGKEGGQDGKHTSSSKNESGFMKGSGFGPLDKKSMKKPAGEADQMKDEMSDPMDEEEEDSGLTKYGMTPKGQKRSPKLKAIKRRVMDAD